ncbi:MAG: hypothetical protein ACRD1K_07865 [Acidimicrobiales bacterium]
MTIVNHWHEYPAPLVIPPPGEVDVPPVNPAAVVTMVGGALLTELPAMGRGRPALA